ncbi:S-adenosyl-L-methionine-dependent methyltransferase [Xylariales sp. PMI_506]|nr:S-adenosyl-L-methionine-dependent methyltransferase [Xylariales sp. PMI_506]
MSAMASLDLLPSMGDNDTSGQPQENPNGTPEMNGSEAFESESKLDVSTDELGKPFQRYGEGKYLLPNDGDEKQRLDFQYAGFSVLLKHRLFLAPISQTPDHVLDVATGTGIWALDFARLFPSAHVIGTDLCAVQPRTTLTNCEFVKEDSEEPWNYDHKFDYVHLRMVFTCFQNPKTVVQEAFKYLKPGGWIEFQDGSAEVLCKSGSIEGSAFQRWGRGLIDGAAKMGRDIQKGTKWKQWLIEAGFVDVVEIPMEFPCNEWPSDPRSKEAGKYMHLNISENLGGLSWKMLSGLGMGSDEISEFLPQVQKDLNDESIQSYLMFYVVYGRKPLDSESSVVE